MVGENLWGSGEGGSFKERVEREADGGCRGVERGARPKVEPWRAWLYSDVTY